MTLTTKANFLEPVDVEKLFGHARHEIGIPQDHPYNIKTGDSREKWWNHYHPEVTQISSRPGGFKAALDVNAVPSGKGDFSMGHRWGHGDPRLEQMHKDECHCRPFHAQMRLDSGYGVEHCGQCDHIDTIRKVARALGNPKLEWQDESTGKWYNDLPAACKEHGGKLGREAPSVSPPAQGASPPGSTPEMPEHLKPRPWSYKKPEKKALDKATLELSRMLKDFGSAPASGALQSGAVHTDVGGSGRKPKGYAEPKRQGSAARAEKN